MFSLFGRFATLFDIYVAIIANLMKHPESSFVSKPRKP